MDLMVLMPAEMVEMGGKTSRIIDLEYTVITQLIFTAKTMFDVGM